MGSEKLDESDIHLPSSLKDFEFQQFNQTCLVACAHNMLIDVACKNNNKNMIKSLRTIRNRCTDLKGRKKEEYFDTTPQPPAPIISYLENLLEKYNMRFLRNKA